MECYRVEIPDGVRVMGATAAGHPSAVLPGEYLVHRLRAKGAPSDTPAVLRFVGADALGRDVHVPLDVVQGLVAGSSMASECSGRARDLAEAA